MSAIEEFVAASEDGDVQTMSALLPKVNVNAANSEGWTALQKVAAVGQFAAAQWLVKSADADVDRAVADGRTPLYRACYNGIKDVAQFLIGAGADLNAAKKFGWTPLLAACPDHPDKAELLIRAGANVNKANDDGATPYVFGRGNATLAKLLLDAGVVGTFNRFTLAAGRGDVETKQYEGVDVNQADGPGWTALQRAADQGQLEAAQWLVDVAGADIERAHKDGGQTPLYLACRRGKNEVAQFLIGKGADVNKARRGGATPLYIGASNGHEAVVESSIAAGADVNKATNSDATPTYVGAQNGHDAVVKSLIAAGADLNKAFKTGATPLCIGARKGHDAVVKSVDCGGC